YRAPDFLSRSASSLAPRADALTKGRRKERKTAPATRNNQMPNRYAISSGTPNMVSRMTNRLATSGIRRMAPNAGMMIARSSCLPRLRWSRSLGMMQGEHAAHLLNHFDVGVRFGYEAVRVELGCKFPVILLASRCEHHDRNVLRGRMRTDRLQHVEPAHL